MLLDLLARLIRLRSGAASNDATDAALAEALIGDGSLATWAELWETIVREKADAAALNLDRKSLMIGTFQNIQAAARQPAS